MIKYCNSGFNQRAFVAIVVLMAAIGSSPQLWADGMIYQAQAGYATGAYALSAPSFVSQDSEMFNEYIMMVGAGSLTETGFNTGDVSPTSIYTDPVFGAVMSRADSSVSSTSSFTSGSVSSIKINTTAGGTATGVGACAYPIYGGMTNTIAASIYYSIDTNSVLTASGMTAATTRSISTGTNGSATAQWSITIQSNGAITGMFTQDNSAANFTVKIPANSQVRICWSASAGASSTASTGRAALTATVTGTITIK